MSTWEQGIGFAPGIAFIAMSTISGNASVRIMLGQKEAERYLLRWVTSE
jgi:hypothetical protein